MTWSPGGRLREERRWVSVLFADVAGFTALAARLDPEDVRALQIEYFARVSRVVHRWRGVVEKYVGDAVLAVFGAPHSDEYDAYRAVLAGLEIQRELAGLALPDGSPVRVRVGIASGEVVVDLAAVRDGGQALVCGDVVNTAARVQALAKPGSVVVTAATRRATATMVRYRELAAITPAGKPEPIDVWRADAAVPPQPDRHDAPMVGRRAELSGLAARLGEVARARTPALVSVVGPPGIGKSRLVREAARADAVARWWFARCAPAGAGPYAPLADVVRGQAGVRDGDDAPTVRHRLTEWAGALVEAGELPRVVDGLATLLGPLAAPDPHVEWACQHLLRAAARQPLVLVLEDLHHADAATVRFVRDLPAAAPRLPLTVLVTDRSELRLGETVPLRPLTNDETRRLLGRLLGRAAPTDRLLRLVGGVPGYAVELARAGVGAGGVWTEERSDEGRRRLPGPGARASEASASRHSEQIPERVRRSVSARLDQLDEPDRAVLQAAAVLGDAVRADAVSALLGADSAYARAALRRLERRGLLARRASATSQLEYGFGAGVVRQVAYARLPRAVRVDHHRAAAEWLGRGLARRRAGVDEERARHLIAASELARALHRDARPYVTAACAALAMAARCGPVSPPRTRRRWPRSTRPAGGAGASRCVPGPARPGPPPLGLRDAGDRRPATRAASAPAAGGRPGSRAAGSSPGRPRARSPAARAYA
ncbi:hypothetical protein Prum_060810 [Phytohabitans rumicis]|uniref:Guanylate cyclase domain-containing protein n=1 Tax=Phytohabitans rumicis TaxID=1076125 RepID=A0A6V8LCW2_9ACTN|nr:hypothetical protein Prum_060810 [Phytohabitans rumicis]